MHWGRGWGRSRGTENETQEEKSPEMSAEEAELERGMDRFEEGLCSCAGDFKKTGNVLQISTPTSQLAKARDQASRQENSSLKSG